MFVAVSIFWSPLKIGYPTFHSGQFWAVSKSWLRPCLEVCFFLTLAVDADVTQLSQCAQVDHGSTGAAATASINRDAAIGHGRAVRVTRGAPLHAGHITQRRRDAGDGVIADRGGGAQAHAGHWYGRHARDAGEELGGAAGMGQPGVLRTQDTRRQSIALCLKGGLQWRRLHLLQERLSIRNNKACD